MNGNENDRILMLEEIRKRLESDDWNIRIARGVRHARRKSRIIWISSSSASVAVASLIVAVFIGFGSRESSPQSELHAFIGKQVEGTYQQVFTGGGTETSVPAVSGVYISCDAVDDIITASLADR